MSMPFQANPSLFSPSKSPTGKYSGVTGGDIVPKGYRRGQLAQFTPEQMQLFQSLFSHLGPDSQLSKLASGDEAQFAQMEAPALKQFSALQGNIASRFSGQGLGGRRSSGFQNEMSSAGQSFAEQLQANRMNLQRQAIQDLMGLSGSLLQQRPYERMLAKREMPFWKQLLSSGAEGAGQGLGMAAGSMLL